MVLQCPPGRSLRRPLVRALQREAVTLQYDFLGATSLAGATRLGPVPSFVRASAASYRDSAGILRLAVADQPRFDHNAAGEPLGLLLEGASTNLMVRSEKFDDAAWVKGAAPAVTITANQATAPDGTVTADRVTGSLNLPNLVFSQTVAISGATTGRAFAQSIWLRNNDGPTALTLAIVETGGAQAQSSHEQTIVLSTGWNRFTNTAVVLEDDRTAVDFRLQANQLGDVDFYAWGAQLEEQAFPSSYIPTINAIGLRPADDLTLPDLSWLNPVEGTFLIAVEKAHFVDSLACSLDDTTFDNRAFEILFNSATNQINVRNSLAGSQRNFSFDFSDGWSPETVYRIAQTYRSDGGAACINGGTVQSLGLQLADPAKLTNWKLGRWRAGQHFNGWLRQVRYYLREMGDADLQALTQLGSSIQYVFAGASSLQSSALAGSPTPSFVRASAASYRDSEGVLRLAAADEPAFDHNVAGEPLGLLVEGGGTNKCENESSPSALVAPTTQTAFAAATVGLVPFDPGGNALYSIEDKSADLLAAGFSGLTNGRAIVVDNSNGSSVAYITSDGITANTNTHTSSVIAWIAPGTTATVGLTPAEGKTAITSLTPEWFSHTEMPVDTGRRFQVAVQAGGTVYIAFAQLEEGFLRTSPIPVNGAASLRAATLVTVDNPPFNPSAGTVVVEFETLESMATAFRYAWAIDDDTPSILSLFGVYYVGSTNEVIAVIRSGGVETTLSDTAGHVKGQPVRVAFSYSTNGFAMSCNGRAVVTGSGALPTELKKLRLGVNREAFVTRFLNSTLSEWRYLPRETPAAELQVLSLPTQVGSRLEYVFAGASSLQSSALMGLPPSLVRASAASYRDSTGVLRLAAADEPIFDYDAAGNPLGLLIEAAATNLLRNSADFAAETWIKNFMTVVPGATMGPDEQLSASKLVKAVGSDPYISAIRPIAVNAKHTATIWLKAAEYTTALFRCGRADVPYNRSGVSIDLITGAVTQDDRGVVSFSEVSAEQWGHGWWRVRVTSIPDATADAGIVILYPGGRGSGDGTSGIYVWGAQLEESSYPTSHIPTSGAAVLRAGTVCQVPTQHWFNRHAGTFFLRVTAPFDPGEANGNFFSIDSGAGNEHQIEAFFYPTSKQPTVRVRSDFTYYPSLFGLQASNTVTPGTPFDLAISYDPTSLAISLDHAVAATATGITMPSMDLDYLGLGLRLGSIDRQLNGYLQAFAYLPYPTSPEALPNVRL